MASLNGFVFGFFRIAWIVIASIYLYNVAVETGQFEVMKQSIAGLSSDKRIQVILIAFCFGAFLEGTGGGGAPVAIAGAFLIGLGFPHFEAATLCLLANTAPVAWGGVGNPIRVLNGVTGLPIHELNAMVGRILPPFSLILPAWLVVTMVGWRKALGVLPALAVSGALLRGDAVLLVQPPGDRPRRHRGRHRLAAGDGGVPARVEAARADDGGRRGAHDRAAQRTAPVAVLKAWSPFALASLLIFLWALPSFNRYLKLPALTFPTPGLDGLVIRTPPVVPVPTPETASMDFNFLALPGTAVFLGAFLSALLLGMPLARALARLVDVPAAGAVDAGDQLHGRPRLRHEVRGDGHRARAVAHAHRLDLPLLRDAARLAGGGTHRHRRGLERALRQPAEGDGRADRHLAGA